MAKCPNCGKELPVKTSDAYKVCYNCQKRYTVKVIGGTVSLSPPDAFLQNIIDRLVNVEYLINKTQSSIKVIEKEIRVNKILKYLSILFILLGIGFIVFSTADMDQLGLLQIGIGIFFLLMSISIIFFRRKKLEMEKRELSKLQIEKSKLEESIQ